ETPVKAKVKGAIKFLEAKGIKGQKEDVFRHFKVSHTKGYWMLLDYPRRHYNNPEVEENRGRKSLISWQDLKNMEGILKEYSFLARVFS
ncbi:hypothetical protein BU16DRAFT_434759, partial [Lophium mytilinum]